MGESLRLTVRIPLTLFERLEEYASGTRYTRGAPQLSFFVREALVAYLDNIGQTKNVPSGDIHISGQTRNVPERSRDNSGQTKKDSEPQDGNLRQTTKAPKSAENNSGQIEKSTPVYDTSKYVLGKLCPRGHEHGSTGQSLLRLSNRHCIVCDREKFHERKAGKSGH